MDKNPFSLTEVSRDSVSCRLTASGRITALNSNILQSKLERCLESGRVDIILNMSQVAYISSAGIRVLLSIYKKADKSKGRFRIASPSENVRNVIGMTALDQLLLS